MRLIDFAINKNYRSDTCLAHNFRKSGSVPFAVVKLNAHIDAVATRRLNDLHDIPVHGFDCYRIGNVECFEHIGQQVLIITLNPSDALPQLHSLQNR